MTLTKEEIIKRLKSSNLSDRIVITPMLDAEDQLGTTGVDLRLGKQFIFFKDHLHGSLNPKELREREGNLSSYQEEIVIPIRRKITLHPGQFLVGSTLEYLAMPTDLEAQVEGRSSWARLGLLIATATTVHPNFKGVITLELSNHGTIPLELYPGMKIAQIIFHRTESPVSEGISKYKFSIGPSFSKIYQDQYIDYFCREEDQIS